jgi:sec-independent protein translocase protein TatA
MGAQELMLILVIVMVLFGGSKLPELAKGLGKSMKEFKKGLEVEHAEDTPPTPAPAPAVPAAASPASRSCVHCMTSIEETWSHCPLCGTAVTEASAPARPS